MRFVFLRNIPLLGRRCWSRLTKKYLIRNILRCVFGQPLLFLHRVILKGFIKNWLVDIFLVQGVARLIRMIAKGLCLINTGSLRASILWMMLGLVFVVGLLVFI